VERAVFLSADSPGTRAGIVDSRPVLVLATSNAGIYTHVQKPPETEINRSPLALYDTFLSIFEPEYQSLAA
jgi:hypothetical protein